MMDDTSEVASKLNKTNKLQINLDSNYIPVDDNDYEIELIEKQMKKYFNFVSK